MSTPVSKRPVFWISILIAVVVLGWLGYQVAQRNNTDQFAVPDLSAQQGEPQGQEVVIYFTKAKGADNVTEGVVRRFIQQPGTTALQFAIVQLLKGPTAQEVSEGYFSEIPQGVKLLGLNTSPKSITINLSKQFGMGGGANSMQQRLKELRGTVKSVEPAKPVYVTVEGQPLQLLGGEGLEVSEPINKSGDGDLL